MYQALEGCTRDDLYLYQAVLKKHLIGSVSIRLQGHFPKKSEIPLLVGTEVKRGNVYANTPQQAKELAMAQLQERYSPGRGYSGHEHVQVQRIREAYSCSPGF